MGAGRSGEVGPDDPIPDKLYFKIGEVAQLVGVQAHVLRYWEKEIPAIRPSKSASNQRRYRRKDVELFREIRRLLYRERYTLAGARKRLMGRDAGDANDPTNDSESSAPAVPAAESGSEAPLGDADAGMGEAAPLHAAVTGAAIAGPPAEGEEPAPPVEHSLLPRRHMVRDPVKLARLKSGLRDLIRMAGEEP